MKIEFDMEDNNVLYDVMDGIFVALLKRQLRDSKEYLVAAYNEDDKRMNQANIDACRVLLDYYTGKDDD
jgi:cyclopropane fatty-acyl-phospholipid synthase-like methyltransferase